MSEPITLARPYAKAVFQLAKTSGQYDKWSLLLDLLVVIVQEPKVIALIKMPQVTVVEKIDFITTVSGNTFIPEGVELVKLLLQNGRMLIITEIRDLYNEYCRTQEQILAVDVCSAVFLDSEQKAMLGAAIEKHFQKKVMLNWREDPSLIGGIIVKTVDKVFDGSVRRRLQALHQELASQ